MTNSRSTSFGVPSARALPVPVTMTGPISPEYVSPTSSVCEWYIHITELPSIGPGPARSGTVLAVGVRLSRRDGVVALAVVGVPSAYGAPSEALS